MMVAGRPCTEFKPIGLPVLNVAMYRVKLRPTYGFQCLLWLFISLYVKEHLSPLQSH